MEFFFIRMDILEKVILYTPGLVSYRKVVRRPQSIFLRVLNKDTFACLFLFNLHHSVSIGICLTPWNVGVIYV